MNTKTAIRRVLTLVIALSLPGVSHAATLPVSNAPQSKEEAIAKVSKLLSESGQIHRKTGESTWLIERPGKSSILVAAGNEFVVLGIIVAVKKNIRATADLSFKLLKLNHNLDYVKAGYDDDDDLFVRNELRVRTIDLASFKAMIQDVIAGADKAQQVVNPFLISP
ncbi:MAG: hypothetical protein ACREBC_04810 [Pyrinomonadaceae bacterium]